MAKKRRANSESTIYQPSDGRWCAQISVADRRLTHYGATQREVKEWRDRKLAETGRGLNLDAADLIVAVARDTGVVSQGSCEVSCWTKLE